MENSEIKSYSKLNKKKFKKSQAHIEVILATILFIGFLLFILIFMRSSYKITEEIPIDKVNFAVMEKINENVGKLSVVLAKTTDSCFDLSYLEKDYGTNFRSIVDTSNSKRITIYYGSFFESNKKVCEETKKNFKVGAYIEEKIILDKNIEKLVNLYNSDYSKLKQDLGIDNFAFEFRDKDNNKIQKFSVDGKIPENAEVKSKILPVRVINSKAEISELILNIKAWK